MAITTKRQAAAEARFHAGLILEAALGQGWGSNPEQIDRFGERGAELVEAAMTELAERLASTRRAR